MSGFTNLPDYLSQLKGVTQDSFLEELDEYNIEVLYKRLAVNSVAFMLMSRCGLDVNEYFDREEDVYKRQVYNVTKKGWCELCEKRKVTYI